MVLSKSITFKREGNRFTVSFGRSREGVFCYSHYYAIAECDHLNKSWESLNNDWEIQKCVEQIIEGELYNMPSGETWVLKVQMHVYKWEDPIYFVNGKKVLKSAVAA